MFHRIWLIDFGHAIMLPHAQISRHLAAAQRARRDNVRCRIQGCHTCIAVRNLYFCPFYVILIDEFIFFDHQL